MRKPPLLIATAAVGALALAGCGGDDGVTVGTPPATQSPVVFETFVQTQIGQDTCNTGVLAQPNNIDFTFANDQDDADPRDISAVTPGCSATAG